MKKTIGAFVILVLLFAGAFWNIRYMDRLIGNLQTQVAESERLYASGQYAKAAEALQSAADDWADADGYTHIFVRHAEINETADAFYELMRDLKSDDKSAAIGTYQLLQYHLDSIESMEHFTIRSIF